VEWSTDGGVTYPFSSASGGGGGTGGGSGGSGIGTGLLDPCVSSRTFSLSTLQGATHIRVYMICGSFTSPRSLPVTFTPTSACVNQKTITGTTWYLVSTRSTNCGGPSITNITNLNVNGSSISFNSTSTGCGPSGISSCKALPLNQDQEARRNNVIVTSKGNGKFDVQVILFRNSGLCILGYLRVGNSFGYFPSGFVEYTKCMTAFDLSPSLLFTDVNINSNQFITIAITSTVNGQCFCSSTTC
jgi:hypothetical protein